IARIPTDGPLDPLHVDGGGGVEDYPAGGDGYENHDGGKGNIGIKQGAGGNISFSLNEAGKVLVTEDGTEFELSTTEWHEFWVTIQKSDSGHTVSVYLDGSTEATVLTVTAGGGSDFGGSYLAMGVGSTGRSGALDVAAFDFSPGVIAPGVGEPAPASVASSTESVEGPTIVDFGDLSGDASYEFYFKAIKAGASTAIAGNNAFAIKLDQWNELGVFGTTAFGVADNVFAPAEGKSVASVFDRDVHVVVVNDTAAEETRLYVDGDHVGVLAGNFELAGEGKVMGARTTANTDPMGEGSVMHKWATYNSALTDAQIAGLAAAAGGDTPSISVVNNGDGTVTVTFEGTLQAA
ncbi:uncharacterized protein METZ01_LOCUS260860, partial [marine metagenome]